MVFGLLRVSVLIKVTLLPLNNAKNFDKLFYRSITFLAHMSIQR